jgi:alpha-1,3-rhamnosyl/mannosyltransferase
MTIHDLSLLRHSNMHTTRAVWRSRLRLPLMTRKATMIITPSDSVRDEVCEHLNIDRSRVTAVPLAPGAVFKPLKQLETTATLARLSIEHPFLLFVGTIEPRKNLLTLIQAFEQLLRTTELRPQLVIAGRMGWKTNEFRSYIAESPSADRIRVTGYVSNEELRALYSSCSAFVYPSIHEGFGLPPLEAMACGAPVVATRVPSLMTAPETVARIVSPKDVNDITEALVELLSDKGLKDALIDGGFRHAASFSWERTASLTSAVYEEAISRAKR